MREISSSGAATESVDQGLTLFAADLTVGVRIDLETCSTGRALGCAIGLTDEAVLGFAFMLDASTVEKDISAGTLGAGRRRVTNPAVADCAITGEAASRGEVVTRRTGGTGDGIRRIEVARFAVLKGMLALLAGTVLVHRPAMPATRRAFSMVHGIALHAGDARGRGITGGTARIPADYITGGEVFTGEVSAITDETSLVGHAEGTAADIAELHAFIAGERVSQVTGLAGGSPVANEAMLDVGRTGRNAGLGVQSQDVFIHAGGAGGH